MLNILYDFNAWLGDNWIAQIIMIYVAGYVGYKHQKNKNEQS